MSPVDEEVYSRMISHIRSGATDLADADLHVPISNFVSDKRNAAERALFQRLPLIIAHKSELPEPGAFLTREVLGRSVLIIRQDDGAIGAFLNMCRHRGGKVELEEKGRRKLFMCKYHGWAYDRGGELRNIPYESSYQPIDKSCNGLRTVKAEERHGFIWLDFSNTPDRSVADYLGPEADAQFAPFQIEESVIFLDRSFTLNINWKLVLDGAVDIMHAPFLHKGGVDDFVTTNLGVWRDFGRHGQLFTPRKRFAERVKGGEEIKKDFKHFSSELIIFPNNVIIRAPDHVEFWSIFPGDTPSQSETRIRFLIPPAMLDQRMTDRLNRSWEILEQAALSEDWPMEATIQANAGQNPIGEFLYGRSELSAQHMHRELKKELGAATL